MDRLHSLVDAPVGPAAPTTGDHRGDTRPGNMTWRWIPPASTPVARAGFQPRRRSRPPKLPARGSGAGRKDMADDDRGEALRREQQHADDVEEEVDVVPFAGVRPRGLP